MNSSLQNSPSRSLSFFPSLSAKYTFQRLTDHFCHLLFETGIVLYKCRAPSTVWSPVEIGK